MSTPDSPKVSGAPDEIWLCYGDLDRDDTHDNCYMHGEVTWCDSAQGPSDVRYVRAALAAQGQTQPAAPQAAPAVPAVTDEMIAAYLKANDAYWHAADQIPPAPDKWRAGTVNEATRVSLQAALAARPQAEPTGAIE